MMRSPASFSVGRLPRGADQPVLRAAEQDEAGRRRWRIEIGAREAVLERQDQRIAERREPGHQQKDRADA